MGYSENKTTHTTHVTRVFAHVLNSLTLSLNSKEKKEKVKEVVEEDVRKRRLTYYKSMGIAVAIYWIVLFVAIYFLPAGMPYAHRSATIMALGFAIGILMPLVMFAAIEFLVYREAHKNKRKKKK